MGTNLFTTRRRPLIEARDGAGTEALAGLERLCDTYRLTLCAGFRHQLPVPEEARALTHGCFAELCENGTPRTARRTAGHFSSYLLTRLYYFLPRDRNSVEALGRGGGTLPVSLEAPVVERRYDREATKDPTRAEILERRRGLTVFEGALRRLPLKMAEGENPQQFPQLAAYLTGKKPRVPRREVASQLGMTVETVNMAVLRMRPLFGEPHRDEISEALANPQETGDDVRHLLTVVRPFAERRR